MYGSLAATLPTDTEPEKAWPRDLGPRVWVYPALNVESAISKFTLKIRDFSFRQIPYALCYIRTVLHPQSIIKL